MLVRLGFFFLCLCFALPAHAEDYQPVTWAGLLRAMIHFNALDINKDNNLFDEYAAITDCDLHHYYFKDDFKWNQIRGIVRKANDTDSPNYPTHFYYDDKFLLDRYDFDTRTYRFAAKTQINRLGSILVFSFLGPVCDSRIVNLIPVKYRVKFSKPLDIPGVIMEPKDSERLLHYMDVTANNEHNIFARFNFNVVYVEPLHKAPADTRGPPYVQGHNDSNAIIMDVEIGSVEFFRDAERTELVYTYTPEPAIPPPSP